MGQAVGLELKLNLAGACSLLDKKGQVSQDPAKYFAGTYTYFYPVQTNAVFSVEWDDNLLEAQILAAAKKFDGMITSEQLTAELEKHKLFTITINPGAFSQSTEGIKLRETFEDDVLKYTSEMLLAQIADSVKTTIADATYQEITNHTQRTGKKRFLRSQKCSTSTYQVTTNKINWALVRANLAELIKPTTGEAKEYRNYYMYDTLFFKPALVREK